MDSFSSTLKDQHSYNKKIESQLAQLIAVVPFATNLEKVNTITIRGGKSTRDPPYPTRIGKTLVIVQEEEKRTNEVEEVGPQEQAVASLLMTQPSHHFHVEIGKPKWMSSLVSS